ncbi:hypothetical protein [Pectobacterium carotovorum]|uniref:hypothetical protein n=1 Tax=Pectobacterium carotovorum TaxID=554 RepID=UPI0020803AE8|nr:hypothetical protein [Pectobacterium carotovorum]GKV89308.1 hypothetical protein PEC301619_12900 [Pectobacterium carotovorum subsp. carotovorum]
MSTEQQQQFLERFIAEQRKRDAPDLLKLWKLQQEEKHLNEIRSFYREINWSL